MSDLIGRGCARRYRVCRALRRRPKPVETAALMLVLEVGLDGLGTGFASAPGDQVLHPAGDPPLGQLFLEDEVDFRVLVVVLRLVAALLAADLAAAEDGGLVCQPTGAGVLA